MFTRAVSALEGCRGGKPCQHTDKVRTYLDLAMHNFFMRPLLYRWFYDGNLATVYAPPLPVYYAIKSAFISAPWDHPDNFECFPEPNVYRVTPAGWTIVSDGGYSFRTRLAPVKKDAAYKPSGASVIEHLTGMPATVGLNANEEAYKHRKANIMKHLMGTLTELSFMLCLFN
ncbi:hypothetical protein BDW22DRAFT_503802 [Trametopsis cervina]|nr:hypothetical protein BDW22DRAFT_503802 [Trametopsis cervina]